MNGLQTNQNKAQGRDDLPIYASKAGFSSDPLSALKH